MAEKVTMMILKVKVDLQCPCCYKKITKLLCKFSQVRDRLFDEKANTVTITVVCCSPEKFRDKLCRKGAKVIKSIEIKEPPKPKPPVKIICPEIPKTPEPPKGPEKPTGIIDPGKPKGPDISKDPVKPKGPENKDPVKPTEPNPPIVPQRGIWCWCEPRMWPQPVRFNGCPPMFPTRTCCGQCSEGHGGGPCYDGYGVRPPPHPCYDGYYWYGCGDRGRGCHIIQCDCYFTEQNPHGCNMM